MGNGNYLGTKFTFGIVLRGELSDINKLVDYIKESNLTVAFQEISQEKMWIKKGGGNE